MPEQILRFSLLNIKTIVFVLGLVFRFSSRSLDLLSVKASFFKAEKS